MADAALLLLVFDSMGRFDGQPGTLYPLLNNAGNFLLFAFLPSLPSLWVMYVHYQVHRSRKSPYDGTFSVIMADIDNFKQINDAFGHGVGDEALEETVKLIRGTLCARDLITRYGGDEFFIVLDGVSSLSGLETVVKSCARTWNGTTRTRTSRTQYSSVWDMRCTIRPAAWIWMRLASMWTD